MSNLYISNKLVCILFICTHYILVAFVLFHRFTLKMENILVNLFRLPVLLKQLFFFAAHSSVVLICYQYLNFFMESFKIKENFMKPPSSVWWSVVLVFAILALYSIIWMCYASFLNCTGFTGFCVYRTSTSITRMSHYSYSIFKLMKNTDSGPSDSLNNNFVPSFI